MEQEIKGIRTYIKSYGTRAGFHKGRPRFFVVCDGRKTDLHYAKSDFAMQKARDFVRACYKPFIDFQGYQANFQYKEVTQEASA